MTRACPFCAERIQAAAILCRFCGRTVEPVSATAAPRDRTLLHVALLALLVLLGITLLFAYRAQGPTGRPVPLSEAIERLQSGEVSHVAFEGERATLSLRDGTIVETTGLTLERFQEVAIVPSERRGARLSWEVRQAGSTPGQLVGLSYLAVAVLPFLALGLFLYLVIRLAVRHALTR